MKAELVDKLKVAAEQFYLNLHLDEPMLSDEEYDELASQYELEYNQSIKLLVDWPEQLVLENEPEEGLDKDIVKDNDLSSAVEAYTESKNKSYCTLKYDGGAIKLIYNTEGKLVRIQSTPDEKLGIIRTEQFWDLVPHSIPKELGIKCIRGEVLVNAEDYGRLARNKANGLINSTVNQDEINTVGFIRWYRLYYFDNNWTIDRQLNDAKLIPNKILNRIFIDDNGMASNKTELVFCEAHQFTSDECPLEPIVTEPNTNIKFQCDGVVVYTEEGSKGFKFYYTDSCITTVNDIIWTEQSNGSYAAVLSLDPITLDDKYIQKASSNGVPKMIRDRCGVGAKVKVILANTTIPKVIEVIEPSDEFNFPVCECGYPFSEEDIFGSTLKCGNVHVCTRKVNKWYPEICRWVVDEQLFGDYSTITESIKAVPHWYAYCLYIDRWDPFDHVNCDESQLPEMADKLLQIIQSGTQEDLVHWMETYFTLTELQYDNMKVNSGSALTVLRKLISIDSITKINDIINEIGN